MPVRRTTTKNNGSTSSGGKSPRKTASKPASKRAAKSAAQRRGLAKGPRVALRLGEYLRVPTAALASALDRQKVASESKRAAKSKKPVEGSRTPPRATKTDRIPAAPRKPIGKILSDDGIVGPTLLHKAISAQRIDRLRICAPFARLGDGDLAKVAALVQEVSVPAGLTFIHEGAVADCLYVIAAGKVSVHGYFKFEEPPLALLEAGEVVGEMGFFTGGKRSASAESLEPTELLRIKYADLTRCFEIVPGLSVEFVRFLSSRLQALDQKFHESVTRRRVSEQSLQQLSDYLDGSDHFSLDTGVEGFIQRVVTTASRLMKADRASLFLRDAHTGDLWSKVAEGAGSREIRVPAGTGFAGFVVRNGETLNIADAYRDERFNRENDKRTGYRTRTVLCGPVRNLKGETIGVIQVINKQGTGRFTVEDERLFKAFAHQAAISVENFNLYQSLTDSAAKMRLMLDVATSVTQTLDLPSLIRKIVAKVTEILHCDRGTFFVYDGETNELFSMEATGAGIKEIRFPATFGISGHTARTGEVLNVPDAHLDSRFNRSFDDQTGYRTRTVLCVPVHDRDGKVVGVVQAINKLTGGLFNDDDIAMLKAISSQIGVAVENAQLYARTESMKNYLQSVQESISNSIITLDDQYRVVTANKAALELFDTETGCLKQDMRKMLGDTNKYLLGLIDKVYAGGDHAVAVDMELQQGEGKASVVNASVLPLTSPDNARRGLVLVLEDITEEKRARGLLQKKMSKEVVDQLMADPTKQKLGGTRTKASVLFSDIRGFTTLSEAMTAEQTVDMLNAYFTIMVEEVVRQDGALDKFIGDAIMAVYGMAYPKPDDAVRCVRTALRMIGALESFNIMRTARKLFPLHIGIGINTGEVVTGNLGSEGRNDFTVIGDTVNIASRLEGLNKQYGTQVLVTESTREEIGDEFALRLVDHVVVKGKAQATGLYEVLGDRTHALTPAQESFQKGFDAYHSRRFDEALGHFKFGCQGHADPLCKVFVARCEHFLQNPPPADWDGVWHATSK